MERESRQNNVLDNLKEGIVLIDKPRGITSFDVIRILRKKTSIKKMGHSGTLDPMASGLLIVAIGRYTKELNKLLKLPKEYIADIQFGNKTDTGDITGNILETKAVPELSKSLIEDVLNKITGVNDICVPFFSAIKKEGRSLYKYARRGESIELPRKKMTVIKTELLGIKGSIISVRFFVESGTYIRSLGEEIGKMIGTFATLSNLRRLKVGNYSVEEALKLEANELFKRL